MPEEKSTQPSTATQPIRFRFEKSASFRSIYAMASWIRVNGNGDIVMSLYQELDPLPSSATYELQADGKSWLTNVPKLEFNPDYQMVRQIEADIIISLEAAKKIRANLDHFIKLIEQKQMIEKQSGQQKAV